MEPEIADRRNHPRPNRIKRVASRDIVAIAAGNGSIRMYGRIWWRALVFAVLASQAHATGQGTSTMQKWRTMDTCAKQAQTAFPDFSAESNAKRDAKLKDCLHFNNLPPRQPAASPP